MSATGAFRCYCASNQGRAFLSAFKYGLSPSSRPIYLAGGFYSRTLSQISPAAASSGQVLSPAVRYLLGTHKIQDASAIEGSGPKNRVLKGDVLKYLENLKSGRPTVPDRPPAVKASRGDRNVVSTTPTKPKPSYTDLPVSDIVMERAKGFVRSKQSIPHFYLGVECPLPSLLIQREDSWQAIMIRSAALALERMPEARLIWSGDELKQLDRIDVSYHVLQDGGVKHTLISAADKLTLRETMDILQDQIEQGSDTTGNISIYQAVRSDIKECTGILSPSQSMSLYISAPQNGATTLAVTLTGDSRALSLEVAGRWLQLFKSFVSESTLL